MMSWRPVLALAAVLPLLAACSGADAVRAQQLLDQAQKAEQNVSSETFSAHLAVQAKGQALDLRLSGGGYMKGPHAGDMVLNMQLSGPVALPFTNIQVAKVGGNAWLSMDGRQMSLPAGSTLGSSGSSGDNPLGSLDITRYVKDVKVQGGQVLNGRAVTKIVGVIDTAAFVQAAAKLGGVASRTGLPSLDGKISDTRVVIFVDDRTHMLVAALADLTLHAGDGDVKMHLDLAITSVNRAVALPAV